ncbi:MAG: tetratricopeptide repeat protein [Elusimicrobia bacterium]|nr:tetratricopeptide repeat protein [Elusimicrobiota bacterium]
MKKSDWLLLLLMVILTFTVYFPAIRGGFVWDDYKSFVNNPLVVRPDGLKQIWFSTKNMDYWPLTYTTFWLERRVWGLNPAGYHLINVTLHTINAILIWLLLTRLGVRWAWLAAAIFALHPVNVESVAWITERKNVLSGMFYFLTIFTYLKFDYDKNRRWYIISIILFILALLSKTSTVMLPVVLLLCHWWLYNSIRKKDIYEIIPFFGLSVLMSYVTLWFAQNRSIRGVEIWTAGLPERIILAGKNFWFYLGKIFFPYKLTFVYPRWTTEPDMIISYIPVTAVLITGILLWRKRQKWAKPLFMGFGYFGVTLLPVLGFFNVYFMRYSFAADHWQYLANIGIIALAISGIALFSEKIKSLSYIAGIPIIITLGILTWKQELIYKNEETLWLDTINKNPGTFMAHNNLGVIYSKRNEHEKAFKEYQKAIELNHNDAETHINLGNFYFDYQKNYPKALLEYKKAIALKPNDAGMHYNLGLLYYSAKQYKKALREFKIVLNLNPDYKLAQDKINEIIDKF